MNKDLESKKSLTAQKYCDGCGQKNFRPNRSLRELFSEFIEDWLGYDSKIYKTAVTLCKPAALSLDYFDNSHHKNHYITPIRLYLLLSIIFFLMTNFGGLSLSEISIDDINNNQIEINDSDRKQVQQELETAIAETDSDIAKQVLTDIKQEVADHESKDHTKDERTNDSKGNDFSITGDSDFNTSKGCINDPEDIFNVWPQWLDEKLDEGTTALCDSYKPILLLPTKEQQKAAKAKWALSIAQRAIELAPQAVFLSLPLLALVLSLFYFLSKRLYVEHLVLLMHSHSFIFGITLLYLGWVKLTSVFSLLESMPLGSIFTLIGFIYLYLSQKWFYKRGWWATLWRFLIFGFVYLILMTIMLSIGSIFGVVLSS